MVRPHGRNLGNLKKGRRDKGGLLLNQGVCTKDSTLKPGNGGSEGQNWGIQEKGSGKTVKEVRFSSCGKDSRVPKNGYHTKKKTRQHSPQKRARTPQKKTQSGCTLLLTGDSTLFPTPSFHPINNLVHIPGGPQARSLPVKHKGGTKRKRRAKFSLRGLKP